MTEYAEKRNITRTNYEISCSLIHQQDSFKGKIINFSLTGLLIESIHASKFSEGDHLSIQLEHFNSGDILSEIHCDIVRIKPPSLGLKFSAIDYDTLMKLKEILYNQVGDSEKIDNEIINFIVKK